MVKDAGLFSAAMADVKPLEGRKRPQRAAPAKVALPPPAPKPQLAKRKPVAPTEPDLSSDDRSFDRDVARALSRGKLTPEATLDLHGMSLAAAERAVGQFLERATDRDFRIVLVVTGKGRPDRPARIRAELMHWLERPDLRPHVASLRAAHPRHGGGGAFYVILRRAK